MKSGKQLAAVFFLIPLVILFSSFCLAQEKAPVRHDSEAKTGLA